MSLCFYSTEIKDKRKMKRQGSESERLRRFKKKTVANWREYIKKRGQGISLLPTKFGFKLQVTEQKGFVFS